MREIKFRALKSGCWYYLILQHPAGIAKALLKQWESGEEVVFETPWSQYTGLTDCKGKEIYEGDIVLVPIGYPEDGKPIYGNFQGVIVYGSPIYFTTDEYGLPIGTTGFFIETKDGCHSMLLGRDEKVIGNIYENKELLESE